MPISTEAGSAHFWKSKKKDLMCYNKLVPRYDELVSHFNDLVILLKRASYLVIPI